ncbi:RteC domain-containing protein [Chryseobacterium sp.]|uniref:RteC domain-containing protein n=1 Tax=Chryseobacterium sp. TaxID=1871047 RepID=UPI0012A8251D|nr:hypothetical protein F7R58_07895 [Chryseobacterium sp.]
MKEYTNTNFSICNAFRIVFRIFTNINRRKAISLYQKYFVRQQFDIKVLLNANRYNSDGKFTTSHDVLVAQILAGDRLEKYLSSGLLHHECGNDLAGSLSGHCFQDRRQMSGSNKLFFGVVGHLTFIQVRVTYIFQELKHNFLFSGNSVPGKTCRLCNHIPKLINGGREQMPDDLTTVRGGIIAFQYRLQEVSIFPYPFKGFGFQSGMPYQFIAEINKGIQPVNLQRQLLCVLLRKSHQQKFQVLTDLQDFVHPPRINKRHMISAKFYLVYIFMINHQAFSQN